MMKRKVLVSLFLVLFAASHAIAQGKPQVIVQVERVFQEKEPLWKVERVNVQNLQDPFSESLVFRSGKLRALVTLNVWKRAQDAHDVFEANSIAYDNIVGGKRMKSRLPNLEDENYIWTNRGSDAWPNLLFRKGHVFVTVGAPSVTTARRFAQHVVEQIPAAP
jgi:hypothetical protein